MISKKEKEKEVCFSLGFLPFDLACQWALGKSCILVEGHKESHITLAGPPASTVKETSHGTH